MNMNCIFSYAFAWLAMAVFPAAARAESTIEIGLDRLAEAVAKSLKELNHSAVVVGDVQPSPRLQAAGGPGLKKTLVAKLEKHGIKESPSAAVQLLPEFTTTFQKTDQESPHNSAGLLFKAKLTAGPTIVVSCLDST